MIWLEDTLGIGEQGHEHFQSLSGAWPRSMAGSGRTRLASGIRTPAPRRTSGAIGISAVLPTGVLLTGLQIRDLVAEGSLGGGLLLRLGPGQPRPFPERCQRPLGPRVHDLSILDAVLPQRPQAVSAQGISHVPGQPENIAYVTLMYPDNLIATSMSAGWRRSRSAAPSSGARTRWWYTTTSSPARRSSSTTRGRSSTTRVRRSTSCWPAIATATCGHQASTPPRRCSRRSAISSTASATATVR